MSGNRFTSVVLATLVFLSVFAGAFAGPAAAHSHGDESDATLSDNGLYWQNQTLEFTNSDVSASDTVVLRKTTSDGDTFKGEYSANTDGKVFINTEGLEGQFILENDSGTELASFEVAPQSLSTEVDNATAYNQEGVSQSSANFTVDSNRAQYDVVINETTGSLDVEDLKQVFDEHSSSYDVRQDADDNDYFVIPVSSNTAEFDGTFADVSTGNYTFEFTVEDTGVSSSENVTVADPGDKDASFTQTTFAEHVGDVVEINVTLDNTQTADLQLGSNEYSGYTHNVSVTNAKSGNVTLLFDTADAGDDDGNSPWSLPSDSDASITPGSNETSLSGPLAAYNYDVAVSVDSLEKDIASVDLQERNTEGVSIHTAPSSLDVDMDAIRNNTTATDSVADGDYAVVEVAASGLYANLDDSTTASDLVEGQSFADEQGYNVEIKNSDPGLNQEATEYDVSTGELFVDAENDTFYLVYDAGNWADIEEGDEPEVTFNMTEDNAYIEDEEEAEAQSANASFEFVDRTFEYNNVNENDVIEVSPSENAEISGTTSVTPGTEVNVQVRTTPGAEIPFTLTKQATVDENGTLAANFDLADYDTGTNFTVSVTDLAPERHDAILDSAGAGETETEYTVNFSVVGANGTALENATVNVGGETVSTDENGTAPVALTTGTYPAQAGADGYQTSSQDVNVTEDTSVEFELAEEPPEYTYDVSVVDANDSAVAGATVTVYGSEYTTDDSGATTVTVTEGEYEFSASADGYESTSQSVTVSDNGSVTLELTEEDSGTEEPANGTDNDSDGNESNNNSSTGGQPGFGIAIALIAIIGAALLARRQD